MFEKLTILKGNLLVIFSLGMFFLGVLFGSQIPIEKVVTIPVSENSPTEISDGPSLPPRHFLSKGLGKSLQVNLPDEQGFDNRWYPVVGESISPVVRRVPDNSPRRDFVALVHADGTVSFTIIGPEN